MKVTELMIGDWVRIGDADKYHGWLGVIRAINNITGYCIVALINNEGIISISNVHIDDIEPIPLTPEILEKNGFEIKEILHQYRWSIFYKNMLILSKVKFDYEIQINGFPRKIHYVHDLQRALRCCGLWDLAENFKI